MRNQIIVSAAVAGLVALVVSLSTGGSSSPPEPVPAETPNLDERVAQLEAKLSSRTTISASSRQARGDSGVTEVGEASAEQMEAIMARRVMAAARTKGWDGEEGEASEEFLEEVGRMVRDEMKQAREEAMERRAEHRAQRRADMVADFVAEHSLDAEHKSRLTELMLVEAEQITELFRAAREDGSWHEARDEAHALREDTDGVIAELLDDEEMEAWREAREENSTHGGRSRSR
jgi:hypothetical protein